MIAEIKKVAEVCGGSWTGVHLLSGAGFSCHWVRPRHQRVWDEKETSFFCCQQRRFAGCFPRATRAPKAWYAEECWVQPCVPHLLGWDSAATGKTISEQPGTKLSSTLRMFSPGEQSSQTPPLGLGRESTVTLVRWGREICSCSSVCAHVYTHVCIYERVKASCTHMHTVCLCVCLCVCVLLETSYIHILDKDFLH